MITTDQSSCKMCCGAGIIIVSQRSRPSKGPVESLGIPIQSSCPDCLIRKQDKLNAEHAKAVAKLIAENRELNDLFDLQQTRMLTATKKWQEATGNPGIFPDLGRLLEWLLANAETNDG